jgi:Ca-activated chloride channel family protein
MHPDAAVLSLSGTLDRRDVDLSSVSSPTHPTVVRAAADDLQILLPNSGAVPDRDFILRWRRAIRPNLLPIAWVSLDQENTYGLVQLRAPDDAPLEILEGNDVYFLVDRSGSMAGEKWTKTAEAMVAFVNATHRYDRVWITFFESDYQDFAERPMERDALLRDRNFQSIAALGTGGGTELLPALRHLLKVHQRFSPQRRSHIVLITDGQSGTSKLFSMN